VQMHHHRAERWVIVSAKAKLPMAGKRSFYLKMNKPIFPLMLFIRLRIQEPYRGQS